MESSHSLDVVAIATKVWEALEPHDPKLYGQHASKGGGTRYADKALGQQDLPTLIDELQRQVGLLCRAHEHLEQQLNLLEQKLGSLPANMMRLEQRSFEIEAQVTSLEHNADAGGDVVDAASVSDDLWLSVREIARRLHLSESTVRRYVRVGILPAARLPGGRGIRLCWADVRRNMAQLVQTMETPGDRQAEESIPPI